MTAGREWSPEEVAELITKRFVGPVTGFRSRMGKPFSAGVRLTGELRPEFDFGQSRDAQDNAPPPDFSGQESLGACPKCGARVFEHGAAYVCEKAIGAGRSCDFRSGKMILQQAVERAQMQKLLATGRTDLLTRFISKKGRPFKAFLAKTPDGKVGFEFQAREPRKPKAEQARAPYSPAPAARSGSAAKPAAAKKRAKRGAKPAPAAKPATKARRKAA